MSLRHSRYIDNAPLHATPPCLTPLSLPILFFRYIFRAVINSCICCWGVGSDLLEGVEGKAPIMPGFGCSRPLVEELVAELQARKVGRGNIAQLKAQEVLAQRVDHMHSKLDLILAHLNITPPPPPALGVPQPDSMLRQGEPGTSSTKQ